MLKKASFDNSQRKSYIAFTNRSKEYVSRIALVFQSYCIMFPSGTFGGTVS